MTYTGGIPSKVPTMTNFTLIWGIMVANAAVIGGMSWFLPGLISSAEPSVTGGTGLNPLVVPFYVIGCLSLVGAVVVPRMVARKAMEGASQSSKGMLATGAISAGGQELSEGERKLLFPPFLIRCVGFELVVVIGLVASLAGQSAQGGLPMVLAGFLGMLWARPTPDSLRQLLKLT